MGPSVASIFTQETLERLAAALGSDKPADILRIRDAIHAHAPKLQMILDLMDDEGTEKEKRKRQRVKLKSLRKETGRWHEKLIAFDDLETKRLIRKGYGYGKRRKPSKRLSTDLAAIHGGLKGIIPALDAALDQIPGGRPSLGLMHEWAGDFAIIYEECSGHPFSYDAPPALTPGSNFVSIAVRAAFPNATEKNLNTVLAGARPGQRKKKPTRK